MPSPYASSSLSLPDRVLEIGFGGGVTLPSLMDAAAFIAGVDRSDDVIGWAQRRFSRQIRMGQADFRQGDVKSLPFNTAAFDKVCTVNTVYFWASLEAGFAEIYPCSQATRPRRCRFSSERVDGPHGDAEDIFTTRAPLKVARAHKGRFQGHTDRASRTADAMERHRRDPIKAVRPSLRGRRTFPPFPGTGS